MKFIEYIKKLTEENRINSYKKEKEYLYEEIEDVAKEGRDNFKYTLMFDHSSLGEWWEDISDEEIYFKLKEDLENDGFKVKYDKTYFKDGRKEEYIKISW